MDDAGLMKQCLSCYQLKPDTDFIQGGRGHFCDTCRDNDLVTDRQRNVAKRITRNNHRNANLARYRAQDRAYRRNRATMAT